MNVYIVYTVQPPQIVGVFDSYDKAKECQGKYGPWCTNMEMWDVL